MNETLTETPDSYTTLNRAHLTYRDAVEAYVRAKIVAEKAEHEMCHAENALRLAAKKHHERLFNIREDERIKDFFNSMPTGRATGHPLCDALSAD